MYITKVFIYNILSVCYFSIMLTKLFHKTCRSSFIEEDLFFSLKKCNVITQLFHLVTPRLTLPFLGKFPLLVVLRNPPLLIYYLLNTIQYTMMIS